MELSPILLPALSIFSNLLSLLTSSLPPYLATKLYRKISSTLSITLYSQLITNRTWSEFSAQQLKFDFQKGFLLAARDSKIPRGVQRGWELFEGAVELVSLKAGNGEGANFSKIMRLAFDEGVNEAQWESIVDDLGVSISKREAVAVLRRRPECWK